MLYCLNSVLTKKYEFRKVFNYLIWWSRSLLILFINAICLSSYYRNILLTASTLLAYHVVTSNMKHWSTIYTFMMEIRYSKSYIQYPFSFQYAHQRPPWRQPPLHLVTTPTCFGRKWVKRGVVSLNCARSCARRGLRSPVQDEELTLWLS